MCSQLYCVHVQSILTIHRVTNATSGDYDAVIDDGRTDPVTTPTQQVSLSRECYPDYCLLTEHVHGVLDRRVEPGNEARAAEANVDWRADSKRKVRVRKFLLINIHYVGFTQFCMKNGYSFCCLL